MSEAIKNCPQCGPRGDVKVFLQHHYYRVTCINCGLRGVGDRDAGKAVDLWNSGRYSREQHK